MSLRIEAPSEEASGRRGPGGAGVSTDSYLDRLVKLIPAEAVAAYPFLHSRALEVSQAVLDQAPEQTADAVSSAGTQTTVTSATSFASEAATRTMEFASANWLPAGVAWLILMMVILLRWQATRGEHGEAQWGAVAIAAISFLLWVPVLDGIGSDGGPAGSFGIFRALTDWGVMHWHPAVQKFVPELLLVLWTILVPAFYRPCR